MGSDVISDRCRNCVEDVVKKAFWRSGWRVLVGRWLLVVACWLVGYFASVCFFHTMSVNLTVRNGWDGTGIAAMDWGMSSEAKPKLAGEVWVYRQRDLRRVYPGAPKIQVLRSNAARLGLGEPIVPKHFGIWCRVGVMKIFLGITESFASEVLVHWSNHSWETTFFFCGIPKRLGAQWKFLKLMEVLKRANQEIFMDQKRILQKIKASWPDFHNVGSWL